MVNNYSWAVGSGSWDDPNSWWELGVGSPAGPPAAGDVIYVAVGPLNSYQAIHATAGDLVVGGGYLDVLASFGQPSELDANSLSIGWKTTSGGVLNGGWVRGQNADSTLSVSGAITIDGSFTSGVGHAPTLDWGYAYADTSVPLSVLNAGSIIVGGTATGILGLGDQISATVTGSLIAGDQAGGSGTVELDGPLASLAVTAQAIIGNAGTGGVSVGADTSFNAGTVVLGNTGGGVGSLAISGTATIGLLVVGSAGTGTVRVFSGGVLDAETIESGDSGVASIAIFGGAAEIGGSSGVGNNTLHVDAGAVLAGQGLIDSDVVGTLDNGAPLYALLLANLGTIEAKGGLLDVHGNITADGTAAIDDNATLEIGGTFAADGTVDFQGMNNGMLILDDATGFSGALEGLSDGTGSSIAAAAALGDELIAAGLSIEPQGSSLLIRQSSPNTNFAVVKLSMGTLAGSGTISFLARLGADADTISQTLPAFPLPKESMKSIQGEFWNVKTVGSDTLLTYSKGNPIDQAVNGPNARSASRVTGAGVIIGVISNGFDTSQLANDQSLGALPSLVDVMARGAGDEGRAMAQVIHAIAPAAAIDFYPSQGGNLADAIRQLTSADCSIIVDDVGIYNKAGAANEPDVGGAVNDAIDSSVERRITYVTAAGNDRDPSLVPVQSPIFGHGLDPYAITVAAMNWLAVPAGTRQVGGYLRTQAEPSSSAAPTSTPGKPDITAPDGGPTTLQLGTGLNPFFGTSAAAPAVAGVAALMLQASKYQLSPVAIDAILRATATRDGVAANIGGAGLVNAQAAVAAAAARVRPLVRNPAPGGAASGAFSLVTASAGPTVIEADLSQPAGDLNSGTTLQVFVTMSSSVTVSGTPALTLNDGGIAMYNAAASDPANASMVFDYAPGSETTANLAITGVVANGAIVQDVSANPADFSALFNVPSGLSVNSPLHVTSAASSQTGEIAAGDTIQISLALGSGVTVVTTGGAPVLELNNGATASYDGALSNPASGTLVFDYAAGSGDATPELSVFDVALPDGATIEDAASNNADFSAAQNQSLGVQVDPSFVNLFGVSGTGAISTGQTAQFAFTMTTPIALGNSGGSPTLSLNDGETASYDAGASDPSAGTLVFDNIVQPADQVPDLQVTQVNLNGAVVNDPHGVAVDFSGALNYPTGLTVNSPIMVTGVTASASGTIGVGQTLTLNLSLNQAAAVAAIDNPFGLPTLMLDDGEGASYDAATSSATSLAFDYVVQVGDYSPDLTIVSVNANGNPIQDALGNNVDFAVASGAATGIAVVACFAEGTRIATTHGEIPVENLCIGDHVIRAHGGQRPIVSLRHRRIGCAHHLRPHMVWPVRVKAHAFGVGVPKRDLFLSPDHAVFVDDVLIPVKYLINGTTIVQAPVKLVTYYHVELPRHDVLLAEGLPTESYLNTLHDADLAAGDVMSLHPDLALRTWEAEGCAPLVTTGSVVIAAKRQLEACAEDRRVVACVHTR